MSENTEVLSETAAIARDLIRFNTSNFGDGRANSETEAAEYIGAYLQNLGLVPRYIDAAPGRTSVVARVRGREPHLPALVVHGHTDVVPADPEHWSVDPFAGVVKDGMLWGRGAVDMKNMDAMILTALSELHESGGAPRRDLIIAFFSDEENGGEFGSHHVVTHHPEIFEGATEAISEVGGYSIDVAGRRAYVLQTGEKALLWIRLTARGVAAHGSRVIANNAVTRLAEAVAAVGREEWPVRLTHTTEMMVAELARLQGIEPGTVPPREVVTRTGLAAGFMEAALMTTSNPTMLSAGYKHNVIPDTASAVIDIRTLPGDEDSVLARVQQIVGDDIEITVTHRDVGLENSFSGPIIDAMSQALLTHDPSAEIVPYLLSGGTDNKALSLLGIRGYGFAPLQLPPSLDFPAMFHGVDERVPLAALDFGHRVVHDFLRDY